MLVLPGEVKSTLCYTTITGTPINNVAGITYFFEIQLVDVYGNLLITGGGDTMINILVNYLDHNSWLSEISMPDAQDWQAIYGTDIAGIAIDN